MVDHESFISDIFYLEASIRINFSYQLLFNIFTFFWSLRLTLFILEAMAWLVHVYPIRLELRVLVTKIIDVVQRTFKIILPLGEITFRAHGLGYSRSWSRNSF